VIVYGFGNKGKEQKIPKYYWTRNNIMVGVKKKTVVFVRNVPKLPMPNRVNALFESFEQGGYTSTGGLPVGIARADSPKVYGWLVAPKYSDVLKTLRDKTGLHTGTPRNFDVFVTSKPVLKQLKSLPPAKHNNVLLADLVALKLNIVASQLAKIPVGFGELIYDDGTTNPFNGLMVKDIGVIADSMMSARSYTALFPSTSTYGAVYGYGNLDSTLKRINGAFEGTLDTIDFTDKLHFRGTRQLIEVPYLRANPSVMPSVMISDRIVIQVPTSYLLYQNYPNPFNPTTTIQFDLPEDAFVTLKVYNMLGQEVAALFDREEMDEGSQEIEFDAGRLASGVYFYRITAEPLALDDEAAGSTFVNVKKMILVK
jgi:hypothetical protein